MDLTPAEPAADRPFMPGYGLPDDGELLPFSWAEERLRDARTYWVATVREDGQPHLMPVWGAWLDRRVLFSTARRSRKTRNLAANPRCTVAPQCAHEAEAVVLEGRAEEVGDGDLLARFTQAILTKYDFDMSTMDPGDPVFAVRPAKVVALDETFDQHATRWTFP